MPGLASMRLASCLAFITFVIAPTTCENESKSERE